MRIFEGNRTTSACKIYICVSVELHVLCFAVGRPVSGHGIHLYLCESYCFVFSAKLLVTYGIIFLSPFELMYIIYN